MTSIAGPDTFRAALDAFRDREGWRRLMLRGMSRDYSWDRQGEEYLRLYDAMR
jgi:starch synthase